MGLILLGAFFILYGLGQQIVARRFIPIIYRAAGKPPPSERAKKAVFRFTTALVVLGLALVAAGVLWILI